MNCRQFEARFEWLLEKALGPAERSACLEHAAQCEACGELLTAVRGFSPEFNSGSTDPLVQDVLQQTIGSACAQAKIKLPAFVDGDLVSVDRDLIKLHLAGCTACERLAETLMALRRELPHLAEAPVDERFTGEVLAATLPHRLQLEKWWRSHWKAWVRRPRFAMEAAYVGVLVVVLVLGAFSTPVSALPQQGIRLIQPNPEVSSVWNQTNEDLGTFWDWVASLFEKVEKETESTEEMP